MIIWKKMIIQKIRDNDGISEDDKSLLINQRMIKKKINKQMLNLKMILKRENKIQ